MRVTIFLQAVFLFLSVSAQAQGPEGVGAGNPAGPVYRASERDFEPWQVSIGYQYNRVNLLGKPFNTDGVNVSLARYFRRWLGAEVQVGTGFFGNTGGTTTPPDLSAKSLFVGAGPRFAYHNRSRYVPWVHVLVGYEHFRFGQTAGLLGGNSALAGPAGGGIDVYVRPHITFRGEADVFVSRFFSTNQRSFQAVTGLVFDF
jgi:hypothetical protein